MRICVTYDQLCVDSHYSEEQYGDWSESYSSNVTGAYTIGENDQTPYGSETFVVPDDATEVFVVYMIYSTGDSFGNADGMIDIIHCTSNEEAAHALAKMITENPDQSTINFVDDFGREISVDNRAYGYFEHIDYVEVEKFAVGSGPSGRRYYVN